ncbi:putative disease resistance RPP13-like protein 1 [Malus domestica]|uniref:putative disease resistance RPP13-like protein 1 n=1 Tax=Malus domestica TaxID=3750 RepID=UPI0007EE002C
MALEVVGGAVMSAFLQAVFEKMASPEVREFIRGKKLTQGLLNKLEIMLLSVNVVLDDAEEMQISNSAVKHWLEKLKESVYDADDLLDEIKTEALSRKLEVEAAGSSTSQVHERISSSHGAFDKSVLPKIHEVVDRLNIISQQKDVLNLKAHSSNKTSHTLPSTSLVEESGVYGRNEDKEAVVKLLLTDDVNDNKTNVIPVVGMGGIGKTTLAQLIYNDDRAKQHFDIQAWVCVSEDFDVVSVTQKIYRSFTSRTCDMNDLNQLQVELKEALKGKKFLLVLDDVWNENYIHWDLLRCPFESGGHGSKIIVTTRNGGVASVMGTLPIYCLMPLSEDDCWLLFVKHVFKNGGVSGHTIHEVIGRQIVRKCKGLPLAAKSLAGLLRSKLNVEDWEKILKSDLWDKSNKESNILPALWLSYHYLSPHLKRCFAYSSIFPKDYEFKKSELVLLWMAEDLLQPEVNERAEEVGEEYFDDLISRSFFQHVSTEDGESFFTMHDLINDLAKFVSGDFCVRLEKNVSVNIVSKARHLSYMKTHDPGFEKFDAKHLRTFLPLSLSYDSFSVMGKVLYDLLPTLQCLRALSLSGYDVTELPNSVGNLKHLRYLNLSNTLIEMLPDTLCSLYNLQTLLLSHCQALVQLPSNLRKLIKLRHLDIRDTKLRKMPPQMDKLKDLQTLSDFFLDKDTGHNIVELKELPNLHGKLCISGLHNVAQVGDVMNANIKDKKHLNELVLKWGADSNNSQKDREMLGNLQPHTNVKKLTIDSYGGTSFPSWLAELVFLRLVNCRYCFMLPPLPSLKELFIEGLNGVVSLGPEFYGDDTSGTKPFSSLQILEFCNMQEWHEWSYNEEGKEAFPKLCQLRLLECPKLTRILPLDYFPKLETLEMRSANVEFLTISQESELLSISKLDIYFCPNFVCFSNGVLHAPHLTKISIWGCKKLRSLPEQMHTLLPSLRNLWIVDCPELESFPEGGLPSELSSLYIRSCKKLIANRMQWGLGRLTSLVDLALSFEECEEVGAFPEEGLLPPPLTTLSIIDMSNLKTMDGRGLRQLICLERLTIWRCPELQCLPVEGLPASLSHLSIRSCPLLKLRCQRQTGEDWTKIAHIPNIEIEWEEI